MTTDAVTSCRTLGLASVVEQAERQLGLLRRGDLIALGLHGRRIRRLEQTAARLPGRIGAGRTQRLIRSRDADAHHTSSAEMEADRLRDRALKRQGIDTLRLVWRDLDPADPLAAEDILQRLGLAADDHKSGHQLPSP